MGKEIVIQVQEAQRVPGRINPRRNTPKHKYKDKKLKATREKGQISYKGTPIRLSADFSAETLQARRGWGTAWSDGREDPTVKNTLPSKTLVQI